MEETHISPQETIDAIVADRAVLRDKLAAMHARLPRPGYTIPMVWRCAIAASNTLVDEVHRYSSADHGSLYKSLLAVVRSVLAVPEAKFAGPHFDDVFEYDEAIQSCLYGEHHQLALLNLEISLREDYWRLSYNIDDDSFRLTLAPPQRRSALVLLDHRVEFQSY